MPFKIVRNDITKMQVDAIVNTANEKPIYSSGTDFAVYMAAGENELSSERKKIGYMKEGDVAITPGFRLPAKYVIHAVSPYYNGGGADEETKLRDCYRKSLYLAYDNQCKSIAFPLISTGNYGYPKEEAIRIAVDEINVFLLQYDMLIYLVVFDTKSTELGRKLYPALETYIDHHYVSDKQEEEYGDRYSCAMPQNPPAYNEYANRAGKVDKRAKTYNVPSKEMREESTLLPRMSAPQMCIDKLEAEEDFSDFYEEHESALKERIKHMSDTFQEYLFYLIDNKGLENTEVYKRAIITKQLFSKIKLNPHYHPDKATAMRLCIGARLNMDETIDLLARAGYALSPCDKRDIIFSFFIENNVYDMIEIDIALEEHGLPCFIE